MYRVSLWFYKLLIRLAAPYNSKAADFVNGRKGLMDEIKEKLASIENPVIWMHAASVGEYQQGKPIIQRIKKEFQDHKIVITFFSPSGYNAHKSDSDLDFVFYLPLDSPNNARKFLSLVNPKIAIFVKYEFWYFYLMELSQQGIPLLMVSSVFRSNQMFFHRMGTFYLNAIKTTHYFFVQDEESKRLLTVHGIDQVSVSGDTRLDQMIEVSEQYWQSDLLEAFAKDSLVVVCGSLWPSDWDHLRAIIQEFKTVKFIIAPHEIDEESLKEYSFAGLRKWSECQVEEMPDLQVLLVDHIGDLKKMYRYGGLAYVGGAFRGAIHNVIEPAAYGLPIVAGDHPNNEKFIEVRDLSECNGLVSFNDTTQLLGIFERLIANDNLRKEMGDRCRSYVYERAGATNKVLANLREMI